MDSRCARRALVLAALAVALPSAGSAAASPPLNPSLFGLSHRHVCGAVTGPHVRCNADIVTHKATGAPLATSSYQSGYAPADLQSAYDVASAAASQGGTETVAIVDAYDNPSAESDLAVYRSQFGLPECTTANGCFRKVNQRGGTAPPSGDTGWGQEIALDLDMVSAVCPNCHILLVEADSNSYADLAASVDEAAALAATQISNSYGGSELWGQSYESHYTHQGVDITVSSGDNGYGVEFPASSPHVTAVGGTHLVRDTSAARGWSESAWSGAGSGCSSYFSKPSWQHDTGCSRRTVADVSAVADPNTGVAVYDSYGSTNGNNWYVFGGTSVASPLVAAIYALAGGRSPGTDYGSYSYSHASDFYDVVGGSNGRCSGSYLCTAVTGYDGPTGNGTPNGNGTPPTPTAPTMTAAPTISGSAVAGQTLTASPGTWTGYPTPTYTYQWERCNGSCAPVGGATGQTYPLTSADVGYSMDVVVTASNGVSPDGTATSAQTAVVQAPQADFTISASPSSQSVRRGGSASYTVTVSGQNGWAGSAALSVSGKPSGSTATFSPSSTSSTSTLTVATTSATSLGNYTLTISGYDGTNQHSVSVTLQVKKK